MGQSRVGLAGSETLQKAALSQLLSGDLMLLKHLISSAPGKPPTPLRPGEASARWSGSCAHTSQGPVSESLGH